MGQSSLVPRPKTGGPGNEARVKGGMHFNLSCPESFLGSCYHEEVTTSNSQNALKLASCHTVPQYHYLIKADNSDFNTTMTDHLFFMKHM